LSRENAADELVVFGVFGVRTAVPETPCDRVRTSRHQFDLRSEQTLLCRFIANSTPDVQPWNWHGPDQRQFLATEVSRDFIPPCPEQISPARRQLLDQPSKAMRNPSHQLNDRNWSKGHASSRA